MTITLALIILFLVIVIIASFIRMSEDDMDEFEDHDVTSIFNRR